MSMIFAKNSFTIVAVQYVVAIGLKFAGIDIGQAQREHPRSWIR